MALPLAIRGQITLAAATPISLFSHDHRLADLIVGAPGYDAAHGNVQTGLS